MTANKLFSKVISLWEQFWSNPVDFFSADVRFWFWLALAVVFGAIGGFIVASVVFSNMFKGYKKEVNSNSASLGNLLVSVFRRELANWMFRRDPDRYVNVYKDVKNQIAYLTTATDTLRSERLKFLSEKYSDYGDLDHFGTREYVSYEDFYSTFDEVEAHYRNLIEFLALKASSDYHWKYFHNLPNDAEYDHLKAYARRWKNKRLEERVRQVMSEYHAHQRHQNLSVGKLSYENRTFSVRPVSHFAEIRYGIHFKDTGDFALHSTFVGDDPETQTYTIIYRTDANYEAEEILV